MCRPQCTFITRRFTARRVQLLIIWFCPGILLEDSSLIDIQQCWLMQTGQDLYMMWENIMHTALRLCFKKPEMYRKSKDKGEGTGVIMMKENNRSQGYFKLDIIKNPTADFWQNLQLMGLKVNRIWNNLHINWDELKHFMWCRILCKLRNEKLSTSSLQNITASPSLERKKR